MEEVLVFDIVFVGDIFFFYYFFLYQAILWFIVAIVSDKAKI